MTSTSNLSRSEKILLYLFEIANGGRAKIRYEDIVAGLFKKYPHEFHLKGYPEYPDSGDLIHKPLYDFKKKGYLNAANKVFSLTERGVELAQQLSGRQIVNEPLGDRLSRSTESELTRVKGLEGFNLFVEGKKEKLSDGDFYNYLGVTVRTPKNSFLGRLETMQATIEELKNNDKKEIYKTLIEYHDFLISKHSTTIEFFKKN